MRKHLLWVVLAALLALFAAGCAKEVEPEATTPETETSSTEPKAEEPEELPPLKQEPEAGDDVAILETDKGRIVLMFYPSRAPQHVENFKNLVSSGFYDGTRFHRCMDGFMIQGGDPLSKDLANFDRASTTPVGTGGNRDEMENEINLKAEFNDIRHVRGVLSMARGGHSVDSASSQFFIMQAVNEGLDGQYSAFGKVVEGLDVVDAIVKTGSPDRNENGRVEPENAVMLKKATMATWPLEEGGSASE